MPKWWKRKSKDLEPRPPAESRPLLPLREFVYLDEVSVRSLLASQIGALPDEVTELLSRADDAEIAGAISASSPLVKAEFTSRYQTSNSQGTQSTRRSVVQSLFKEFRELDGFDLTLKPTDVDTAGLTIEQLVRGSFAAEESALKRGVLVEVEVELTADPTYRFSAIISELSEMARESPELLSGSEVTEFMAQAEPVNRVLQRLLAGLIPLRATATDVVAVQRDGARFLVPRSEAARLGEMSTPLEIVGVTEHQNYWKDVRRVLFSGAQFTVLCRVGRGGLAHDWTPVKLANVLGEVAPGFESDLADLLGKGFDSSEAVDSTRTQAAFAGFIDAAVARSESEISPPALARATTLATSAAGTDSITGQNTVFRQVRAALTEGGLDISPEDWLELTRQARADAGLALYESPRPDTLDPRYGSAVDDGIARPLLLDTEVIAIYW